MKNTSVRTGSGIWTSTPVIRRIGLQAGRLRSFLADRSGASAIEFAFLAPILLAIYLSSFEITTGYTTSRKVLAAAGTVADVVTRQTSVDKAFLSGMIDTAEATVTPDSTDGMTMKITGVTIDSAGTAKVLWSWDQAGDAPYMTGASVSVPEDMRIPSTFLVHAEISLPHDILLFLPAGADATRSVRSITIYHEFFYRQRLGNDIPCSDCS
jgi:Flp pilus assembly protein TadG